MQVVIISGPPGSGTSAVADALCQRYDRMLHIDVEKLREQLRMGLLRSWDQSDEARAQRELFAESACDMAERFLGAGYGVVIDGVITPGDLAVYQRRLGVRTDHAHFVVLLPTQELLATHGRIAARSGGVREQFAAWHGIVVVDPEGLAPDLVADRVMALAAEGQASLTGA